MIAALSVNLNEKMRKILVFSWPQSVRFNMFQYLSKGQPLCAINKKWHNNYQEYIIYKARLYIANLQCQTQHLYYLNPNLRRIIYSFLSTKNQSNFKQEAIYDDLRSLQQTGKLFLYEIACNAVIESQIQNGQKCNRIAIFGQHGKKLDKLLQLQGNFDLQNVQNIRSIRRVLLCNCSISNHQALFNYSLLLTKLAVNNLKVLSLGTFHMNTNDIDVFGQALSSIGYCEYMNVHFIGNDIDHSCEIQAKMAAWISKCHNIEELSMTIYLDYLDICDWKECRLTNVQTLRLHFEKRIHQEKHIDEYDYYLWICNWLLRCVTSEYTDKAINCVVRDTATGTYIKDWFNIVGQEKIYDKMSNLIINNGKIYTEAKTIDELNNIMNVFLSCAETENNSKFKLVHFEVQWDEGCSYWKFDDLIHKALKCRLYIQFMSIIFKKIGKFANASDYLRNSQIHQMLIQSGYAFRFKARFVQITETCEYQVYE